MKCLGFEMKNAVEAYWHMNLQLVEEYGSQERYLCRCKTCGRYVLVQDSEYHDMSGGDDCYYKDYFPVDSPEAADELNRKYGGFDIEFESGIRFLIVDDYNPHWSIQMEE